MNKLSEELIRKSLEDILYAPNPKTGKSFATKLPKGFDLDDQIKDGYLYQVSNEHMTLMTGAAGIRDMIKSCRESGLGDDFIVGDISVVNGSERIPIINAVWTPITKN